MDFRKVQFLVRNFFFLFCLNDLPKITTKSTKLILYADDTSMTVTNPRPKDFKINLNKVYAHMNKCF
jgi:hypothetical protein